MGIANFYLKFKSDNITETVCNEFKENPLFIYSDYIINDQRFIELECAFDNFLPTLLTVYNAFKKTDISEILLETYGVEINISLNTFEDFVREILKYNKEKLLGCYN